MNLSETSELVEGPIENSTTSTIILSGLIGTIVAVATSLFYKNRNTKLKKDENQLDEEHFDVPLNDSTPVKKVHVW